VGRIVRSLVLLSLIVSAAFASSAAANAGSPVYIDGERVMYPKPQVRETGVTYVPFRSFFERIGADVAWDENTGDISVVRSGERATLHLGSERLTTADGRREDLRGSVERIGGTVYVPLRAAASAFGGLVGWEADGGAATVTTGPRRPGKVVGVAGPAALAVEPLGEDRPTAETIRLAGVAVPPGEIADAAAAYLEAALLGERVWIEPTDGRHAEQDGQRVYVYKEDGTMVNASLLAEGYGYALPFEPDIAWGEWLCDRERLAESRGRGVWAEGGALDTACGRSFNSEALGAIQERMLADYRRIQDEHRIVMLSGGGEGGWLQLDFRKYGDHKTLLTPEQRDALAFALYEKAGSVFPIRLSQYVIPKQPDIEGVIEAIGERGDRVLIVDRGRLLGPDELPEAVWVTLAEDAEVVFRTGDGAFAVGQKAKAWFAGIMLTSYPGQTQGVKIEIVE